MKRIALIIACTALTGCLDVTATRKGSGTNSTDTVRVRAFLETINNGTYGTSNGLYLSSTSATPDQQTIAILAGAVVELGKLAATNRPAK